MGRPHQLDVLEDAYVAEVTVTRSRIQKRANGNGYFDDPSEVVKTELLTITLKGDSVETLKAKLHAHIGLLEEE